MKVMSMRKQLIAWVSIALLLGAAGASAQAMRTVASAGGPISVSVVAEGLEAPWSLAFLPDGRMLVSERPGRLRIVGADGRVSAPLAGVPEVTTAARAGCWMWC